MNQPTPRIIILFIIISSLFLCASSSAWLSGFEYKKEHVISYSGSDTLNNYQMRFVFYNTTGTDSDEKCYLGSHINQTDWDDLRITTTSDGICDIWFQENGANYAIVWAEIPYIYPSSDNRIFIYYGKPTATSVSDGDATFRFWGTFEQIPLNVAKWGFSGNYTQYTYDGTTLVDIVNNGTSGVSRIYSLDTFAYATGYELVGRVKLDLLNESYFGFITGTSHALFRTDAQYADSLYTATRLGPSAVQAYTNLGNTYFGWQILHVQRAPSEAYVRFQINGTTVANHTTRIPTAALATEGSAVATGANMSIDWLFIKRFVDPEPQHSIWESETVETAPNAKFEASPRFGTPGTTVYFSDISMGIVDSWEWDVTGDGITDYTTKHCNYTYNSVGYYDVTLSATNTNGTSIEQSPDFIYIYAESTPTPTPTDSLVEIVDVGASGVAGVMVSVFVYALLIVGMISGILLLFKR